MPKRALVLIDIQNDYFPGGKWTLRGIESAADNAARVLAAARAVGDLVVHVRHEFPTPDASFFAPGSDGARIHPKVRNLEGEPVVLKHHVNSFRETDLKAILDRHGVEEVVICGAMSHMCVDAGTRAASDLGYKCVVVHDACATRDQEFEGAVVPAAQVHAAFMAALGFGCAKLVTTEEYVGEHAPRMTQCGHQRGDEMIQRELGRSGVRVSEIGLGYMGMSKFYDPKQMNDDESIRVIH